MPKKSRIIQVPMPEQLLASLDELSHKQELSRSAVIREACSEYVASTQKAAWIRQYIEGYEKYPEEDEGGWREKLAAEVWGDEDWSEEYKES